MIKLNDFFERDAVVVARELLGKVIVIGNLKVRIVETEAYGGDAASHAFKRTERSALMFDTFGSVYVYLIYGMYNCLNFTTNSIGSPGAVLIRAVEPISGIEKMQERRGTEKINNLCSGPGKLCQALGIDKKFNGLELGRELVVYDDGFEVDEIGRSSRIGIKDALDLEWRFFIVGNGFVSK
ncbi:3-methyladenine DNA glycosylase [archaeon]|nr:3-methyladenine DNA glycosylase [archaeon]|tara:strand:- start:1979 stop:2524 length:546 start_codon:yes stop_codon:yes gene_type:complete